MENKRDVKFDHFTIITKVHQPLFHSRLGDNTGLKSSYSKNFSRVVVIEIAVSEINPMFCAETID